MRPLWRHGLERIPVPRPSILEPVPEGQRKLKLEPVPVRSYRPMTTKKSLSPLAVTNSGKTAQGGNAGKSSAKERAENAHISRTSPAPDTRRCKRERRPRKSLQRSSSSGQTERGKKSGTDERPAPVPALSTPPHFSTHNKTY